MRFSALYLQSLLFPLPFSRWAFFLLLLMLLLFGSQVSCLMAFKSPLFGVLFWAGQLFAWPGYLQVDSFGIKKSKGGGLIITGNIYGMFALFLWSMSASVLLFLGDIPPFQLSATIMFATAFISFVRGVINKNFKFVFHYKRHWLWGALFFAGSELSYYTAFYFAPPVQIDLINYLWPILVILFNFIKHRKSDKYLAFSAVLGFLGVYSIFAPQMQLFHLFSKEGFGYALALLGSVFWACYIIYHKNHGDLCFYWRMFLLSCTCCNRTTLYS